MRKSSWIVLGIGMLLGIGLGFAYLLSHTGPENLTEADAVKMINRMQEAATHKDVGTIMSYISSTSDTKITNLNTDQLRLMLAHALRSANHVRPDVSHIAFHGGLGEASVDFDLIVFNEDKNMSSKDYEGHITLNLRRIDVPHLLGLYQTKEWRVVGGSTTGPDPASWLE